MRAELGSLRAVPQRAWPVGLIAAPPLVEGLLGPGRAAIVQQRVRILACQVVVKAVRSRPGGPGAYERRRWEVHRVPDRCRLSLDTRVTRIADALHGDPHEAKAQPRSAARPEELRVKLGQWIPYVHRVFDLRH